MTEKIRVFVNDSPVSIYRGMRVEHALIALDGALYLAARRGEIIVVDQRGFRLGLDGALEEGSCMFTRPTNH